MESTATKGAAIFAMIISLVSFVLMISSFVALITEPPLELGDISKSFAFWFWGMMVAYFSMIFYFIDAVLSIIKVFMRIHPVFNAILATVLIISVPAELIDEGNLPKKPSGILNRLGEVLTPVYFEKISGEKLCAWVEKHFAHNGVRASREVCRELIEYSGKSMFTLSAETDKISFYALAHGKSEITQADVHEIANPEISAGAFDLANALADGRYADALGVLGVEKFRRTDPIVLMSEVSRTLCDLMTIKALLDAGYSQKEISVTLKMNEYKTRLYCASASAKSRKRLEKGISLCSDADLALKLSSKDYQAIEKLICSL